MSASPLGLALAVAALLLCMVIDVQAKPPNILFILADDLGIGEVEVYPAHSPVGRIATPVLNQLATESVLFTNAYSGSPVCAPSRCVLMTGVHSGHAYIRGNRVDPATGEHDLPLPSNVTTVAAVLKTAGYNTAMVGKWGLGYNDTSGAPRKQGFDYYYGQLGQDQAHNLYPPYVWENEDLVKLPTNANASRERCMAPGNTCQYADSLFNAKAIEWVKQQANSSQPWFLYYTPTVPHAGGWNGSLESGAPVPSDGPYANRTSWPVVERDHAAAITVVLDAEIGKLLAVLDEIGQRNDTVVFFASDNGAHNEGGHDVYFFDSPGIYRGFKRSLYEGGVRTPAMIRWPGVVTAGTVSDYPWAFWDFMATAADIAGIATSALPQHDGVSIVPVLRNDSTQDWPLHPPFYFEFCTNGTWGHSLRSGDWKIVSFSFGAPLQLYNVVSDPSETNDLSSLYPEVVQSLQPLAASAHADSSLWPVNPCISSFLLHEDE